MTAAAHIYTKFPLSLATKKVNLVTPDALEVLLLNGYTVGSTQDTAQFVSDVLAASTEVSVSGTNYARQALSSITFNEAGHVYTLGCANPSWANASFTVTHALFFDSTPGTDSTNPVISYADLGGAQTVTAQTFTLAINASGLATLTGS